MDLGLSGKRVLVTGATGDIGQVTTREFVRAGARVVAGYRSDKSAADELVRSCVGLAGSVEPVMADVTDENSVGQLADRCRQALGGLDVLVNNAGVDGAAPLERLDADEWRRVVDVNLTGCYLVTRSVLDLLADGASIVNLGASVAERGRPGSAHYTAAKAALTGLTRSLCKEVGRRAIRVNIVAPGVVDTGADGPPPVVRDRIRAMTALGRLADPADVTGAVLFLASDLSRYVTGSTLTVDGGM